MSINQQYKASGSQLPFKDWLYEQQMNGKVDFTMQEENNKSVGMEVAGVPFTYILIAGVILFGGIYVYRKMSK